MILRSQIKIRAAASIAAINYSFVKAISMILHKITKSKIYQ